jgi:uncharacterized protein (DUF1330 family)
MSREWLHDRGRIDIDAETDNRESLGVLVAKGYFMSVYRQIKDPEKLAAYAKLAGPAFEAAGGRFLARGVATQAYEAGQLERTVVIEFDSVAQAIAAYESAAYRRALEALGDGAVRDVRIVAGV